MSSHNMPQEDGLDHTLALLEEGYQFILNRQDRFDSRVFQTKILGEAAICLVGKQEAELFYDDDKFIRKGAAPKRVQKTLFGQGGVQSLDGIEHRQRKEMFLFLMNKESLSEISRIVSEEWRKELTQPLHEVNVYESAKHVLARTALRWTGIPFDNSEEWVEELSPLFEYASNIGWKHWQSRRSRKSLERKIEKLVEELRAGNIHAENTSAFHLFTWHRNKKNELLATNIVAVELLNVLRPITAISVYIDFLILAVHQYPNEVDRFRKEKALSYAFVQEVRRYYPFFPFVIARVKRDFQWKGYGSKKDTLTLLDLYGTNHDPEIWSEPNRFQPDRFKDWDEDPFSFIPQGGGEFDIGHRCPGEYMTIEILRTTLDFFVEKIRYTVPEQDFTYEMNKIPSLPTSNMIIKNVTFA